MINSFYNLKRILFLSGALIAFQVDSYGTKTENNVKSLSTSAESLAKATKNAENPEQYGPAEIVSTNSKEDIAALAKLKVADNHRNSRTNLGKKNANKEATRLYKEVMDDKNISPDVRARAKINYADVYTPRFYIDYSLKKRDRNRDSLRLLNEVIHETNISADFKGWAKRRLSKLYLSHNFNLTPAEANKKALSLLEEVCKDTNVSPETRGRTKIELAKQYLAKNMSMLKDLGITAEERKAKAVALFNEVSNDSKARPDLRAEAKMALADNSTVEGDFSDEKMLALYKEVIADKTITNIMRAEAKLKLAEKYTSAYGNNFNLKKCDAAKISIGLMQEVVDDKTLPLKERLEYKMRLRGFYGDKSYLSPRESAEKSLALMREAVEESRVDAKEHFKYRRLLALNYSYNAFHQKQEDATKEAKKIFTELLADATLPVEDKADIRLDLGNQYLKAWWHFSPIDGKDVKTATMALYNEIVAYPDLDQEKWFDVRCIMADMYIRNTEALNMKKSEGKTKGLRLYNKLFEDRKLTLDQKKKIKKLIRKIEKEES